MSNKYLLAVLKRAEVFEELFQITKRRLDAAERKLEKARRRHLKEAYKLGYMRSKESTWEVNIKMAIAFRIVAKEIPEELNSQHSKRFFIDKAKYYITEAWLARTSPSLSSLP